MKFRPGKATHTSHPPRAKILNTNLAEATQLITVCQCKDTELADSFRPAYISRVLRNEHGSGIRDNCGRRNRVPVYRQASARFGNGRGIAHIAHGRSQEHADLASPKRNTGDV